LNALVFSAFAIGWRLCLRYGQPLCVPCVGALQSLVALRVSPC